MDSFCSPCDNDQTADFLCWDMDGPCSDNNHQCLSDDWLKDYLDLEIPECVYSFVSSYREQEHSFDSDSTDTDYDIELY